MKLYETITAENWIKFRLRDDEGRACLVGRAVALRYQPDWERLREAIVALFPGRGGDGSFPSIVEFNNHPDTTVEDVIRVCKLADV